MAEQGNERAFSCIDQVAQCMADEERSSAFRQAIFEVVKPHHHVADIGTGTGLLALFAAQAGARKVTALEFDPFVAEAARQNVKANNFQDKIIVLEGDATSFNYDDVEPFDVVVMELLTTGMIDELQVQAINNLHAKGKVHKDTVYIPYRVDTSIALVNVNYELFNLQMKMIRHLWKDFPHTHRTLKLTAPAMLSSVEFGKPITPEVQTQILTRCTCSGTINGVLLNSTTYLSKYTSIGDTLTLNAPVVIPTEDLKIDTDSPVSCTMDFTYGRGYESVAIALRPMENSSRLSLRAA